MSVAIRLFWNVGAQSWQTTEDFQPSGGTTFGNQWFLLPEGFSFDGSGFTKNINITGASLSGQFQGSLRAGKYDVEPGSISISGASINASIGATLNTDPVSNLPYLSYNGINAPLIPFDTYRGARNA